MKTALYLVVVIAALYAIERWIPGPGEADVRGPALPVTAWPWEPGRD